MSSNETGLAGFAIMPFSDSMGLVAGTTSYRPLASKEKFDLVTRAKAQFLPENGGNRDLPFGCDRRGWHNASFFQNPYFTVRHPKNQGSLRNVIPAIPRTISAADKAATAVNITPM
jgi:hypothetical protein